MPLHDFTQIALYVALLLALTVPTGRYLAAVFEGRVRALGIVERGFYRLGGVDVRREHSWAEYAIALLVFNAAGFVLLMALLMLQGLLPLNPQQLPGLSWHLAFNTAASFVTNTNWQSYGGESTLSYLSQMLGLCVQNFLSAATGVAVAMALIRGLAKPGTAATPPGHERADAPALGNFWVDVTRVTLYVLLPLSLLFALLMVWQGVPQNFDTYVSATTLEGGTQHIAQGPVASQLAIKQLGTNGGGFFNVNSAHPFENPTPLSNLLQMLAILWLPAALVYAYGRMVGDLRQGFAIYAAMLILLLVGLALTYGIESGANPLFANLPLDASAGNLEGKETRFGVVNSAIWATATTAASNGSVNAMHDSFLPLGALVPLVNMMIGEVVFGGVGAGLYGMLLYVLLTVFLAGLMVGRTPEYLGKKIEAREVRLLILAMLSMPLGTLVFGALAIVLPASLAGIQDAGPHGLTELLYAYTSATANNGSAFAGFTANTPYTNTMLGLAMILGRYAYILPLLAVAGSLAAKRKMAVSSGTFPTHGPLFVGLLIGVILMLGLLSFLPVLVLGPVAEHFAMTAGNSY
ncbi:MAG: potassium-transporting ATPase subunit KdpA [Panacagrimonas sp.]